jgi:hypothetical protein
LHDDNERITSILGAGILVIAFVATLFVYKRSNAWASTNSHDGTLKDIWEERRRNGTLSSNSGKTNPGNKPFGSSYYYAHNNPNATGGYKDGLRMEDFTMNQPRLLSKGGVMASASESNAAETRADNPTIADGRERRIVPTTIAFQILVGRSWRCKRYCNDSHRGIARVSWNRNDCVAMRR